jgi:hypothetical protein
MINNISWASYWYALSIMSFSYYLLILVLFYRLEIQHLLSGKLKLSKRKPDPAQYQSSGSANNPSPQDNSDTMSAPIASDKEPIEDLLEEMSAYLLQAGKDKATKGAILHSLRHIFKKYPHLKKATYSDAIKNVIILECRTICTVTISEDELFGIWDG